MPILTISLDFELLWGVFDKPKAGNRSTYFYNTRQAVPKMLELFEKNQVEVTWATVGMLMAENEEEWFFYQPSDIPVYENSKHSAYRYVLRHGLRPEMHFAPDLVEKILQIPGQELASHTFSHFYTQEPGSTLVQFASDLQAAQKIAKTKFGEALTSLVFPRNQYSEDFLKVCKEEGFSAARTNPDDWFWDNPHEASMFKKIVRSADGLLPIGKNTCFSLESLQEQDKAMPISMPASRFFRPVEKKYLLVDKLNKRKIKQEMECAAQNGLIYHLWWHPHNFGNHTEENLNNLESILQHYSRLKDQYGMESLNMRSVSKRVQELSLKTVPDLL